MTDILANMIHTDTDMAEEDIIIAMNAEEAITGTGIGPVREEDVILVT